MARRDDGIDYRVLSLPNLVDRFTGLRGRHPVVAWPHGQEGIRPPEGWRPPAACEGRTAAGAALRALGARLAGLVRRRDTGTRPSSEIDRRLRAEGVAAVHFPFQQYFLTGLPSIYEPWDLQHRYLPEFFDPLDAAWRDFLYERGCRHARLVITASRWTKEDLVRSFGIDPRKIAVVERGSALFESLREGGRQGDLSVARDLPEGFLLYPAVTYPHKNHLRLLQALARIRDEHGEVVPLVCTGRTRGAAWEAIQEAVGALDLVGQVRFLGPVGDDQLIGLYRTARALIFPSLFEGLGLPVVEALQLGLPVIAARTTCLPEVLGGAGILFDPTSVEAMAEAIRIGWHGHDRLRSAAEQSTVDLDRFGWTTAGAKFAACYRHVGGQDLGPGDRALIEEIIR